MFAKHTHIMILSDEIYEHINFAAKHESIAQFDSVKDQTIIVNGVSKAYAMTGWRLGYMAAPVVVAQACEKIQGQFTSGTNSIAQKAAIAALQTPISLLAEMKRSFLRRRNLIIANLKDIPGILVNEPQGAFYVFPDVSAFFGKKHDGGTIQTANDLSMYLLSDAKVAVVTGETLATTIASDYRMQQATTYW
jgi:aspartate aminotransferase